MTGWTWMCFLMLAVAVGPRWGYVVIIVAWLAFCASNPNDRIAKLEKRIKELEVRHEQDSAA